MGTSTRAELVAQVDAFMALDKRLADDMPEFGPKIDKKSPPTWSTNWTIETIEGVSTGAYLSFNHMPGTRKPFTITLIFRSQCVTRLDWVSPAEPGHRNPHWAKDLGLPPSVQGPHVHLWEHNRGQIQGQDLWQLPCRVAIQPQIRRFEQAFFWFADQVKITLTGEQRKFALPDTMV